MLITGTTPVEGSKSHQSLYVRSREIPGGGGEDGSLEGLLEAAQREAMSHKPVRLASFV